MSAAPTVFRDERTTSVENASFRWGYLALSFGLLAAVAYRGLARGENSWDLLALVIGGGVVTAAYQGANRVLTRQWFTLCAVTILAAAGLAAAVAWLR